MRSIRRHLRNEADYERALAEVALYFENPPAVGTEQAHRFDHLATVIAVYEAKHWPIEAVGQSIPDRP